MKSLGEGHQPSGDQIPWKFCEQFQDTVFPSLSGARIVRIAVHPSAMRVTLYLMYSIAFLHVGSVTLVLIRIRCSLDMAQLQWSFLQGLLLFLLASLSNYLVQFLPAYGNLSFQPTHPFICPFICPVRTLSSVNFLGLNSTKQPLYFSSFLA